jgi:hypothetical protein
VSLQDGDEAVSPVIAELLMIALVVLLAAIVFLLIRFPDLFSNLSVPSIFTITAVYHLDEHSHLNYDSRLILTHTGAERYENDKLWAEIFRNGVKINCIIDTMNGGHFIPTHHNGVERMWGPGCSGQYWDPGELLGLDLPDGTFRPGDEVRVDIYSRNNEGSRSLVYDSGTFRVVGEQPVSRNVRTA